MAKGGSSGNFGGGADKHPQASIAGIVLLRFVLGGLFLYLGLSALTSLADKDSFIDRFSDATTPDGLLIAGNVWPGLAHFLQNSVHPHITGYAWLIMLVWLLAGVLFSLGLLTRLAALLTIPLSIVFLLSTLFTAQGNIHLDSLSQYATLLAMQLAVLIAAAGRTWGLDRALAKRTKVKLLW